MKPTKCPAKEKMRQEKLNKREGEKAKRKSQDCWVTFMLKNEILLSAHARTSQANFWRLDQRAPKCSTTCKLLPLW